MFSCPKCGTGCGSKDEFCSKCGVLLPDKTEKVAVLLVPISPCEDSEGYVGRWRLVWPARKLNETCLNATNKLRRHHSQGAIALFEPAMMDGMVIKARSWIKCDLYDDNWPMLGERSFVLVSLEPIEVL